MKQFSYLGCLLLHSSRSFLIASKTTIKNDKVHNDVKSVFSCLESNEIGELRQKSIQCSKVNLKKCVKCARQCFFLSTLIHILHSLKLNCCEYDDWQTYSISATLSCLVVRHKYWALRLNQEKYSHKKSGCITLHLEIKARL